MKLTNILGRGTDDPDAIKVMAQGEIRKRNITSVIYLSAVALPVLLVIIGFFTLSLDGSSSVMETWRGNVISMLYALVGVFSVSGVMAYFLKVSAGTHGWLKGFLPRAIYPVLPFIGALISTTDQLVTPSLNAYLIFCLVPSIVILIEPRYSFLCSVIGYAALYWALPLYQTDPETLLSNRANGMAAAAIGFCLSVILYRINLVRYRQQWQITEQKQVIEESFEKLSESYAANQKFFSIISHDLRGPLSSTVQLSGMLAKEEVNIPEGQKAHMLGLLYDRLEKTSKLLDNLLAWSRTQTDSMPYEPIELNLSLLVEESMEPLLSMAREKRILINSQIPEGIILNADREMVSLVIRNLVANALKFTADNGRVDIEATYAPEISGEPPFALLCVKDSGMGMDSGKASRLFKVGNRVSTLGTRKESGTGLGLVLCKEFVERHGGRISVVSELNEGSTFCVTFPCAVAVDV